MRSSSTQYGIIVMGVGGIGSTAVYHLAQRGPDVLGLDQHDIPSSIDSLYGDSRLIRLTSREDPEYVPHVRRSIPLWESLGKRYSEQFFHHTGTVDADPTNSEAMRRSLKACTDYDLPCEHLFIGELSRKFPDFEPLQGFEVVYQSDGRFIDPTRCVQACVEFAQRHGATVHAREIVVDWESTANSVTVETDRTTYEANHVVVTAGTWTQLLVEELEEALTPWRVIVGGFQPENRNRFMADSFPIFSIEDEQQSYYGGLTAGALGFRFDLAGNLENAADLNDFDPRPIEEGHEWLQTVLHESAQRYFPEGAKNIRRLKTYVVTHTSDQDFAIDYSSSDPSIVVDAGFSGKSFKFSCLMGELLVDPVTESGLAVDIDLFDIG